jgi:hypothetical protein
MAETSEVARLRKANERLKEEVCIYIPSPFPPVVTRMALCGRCASGEGGGGGGRR